MGQLEEPAYFVTHGNRLFDMHNENGENCMAMGDNWQLFGRNSGAIADSYTFGLSSSGAAAGLSYFRNRFYDARTGRFAQEDPIGFNGGDHLYGYAGNNRALYTDSFGLCPETGDDLPCIDEPIAPVIVEATKRDPRLSYGSLIDMAVPGAGGMGGALWSTMIYATNLYNAPPGACSAEKSEAPINVAFDIAGGNILKTFKAAPKLFSSGRMMSLSADEGAAVALTVSATPGNLAMNLANAKGVSIKGGPIARVLYSLMSLAPGVGSVLALEEVVAACF